MKDVSRLRDPALRARVGWGILAVVLLWPLLVATELSPSRLLDAQSWRAIGAFAASALPPAHDAEFLALLARETWITIAIATCGLCLALLVSVPLTLAATGTLSVSRLGRRRMGPLALAGRQLVRWIGVALRSVPELVFALLFVRVVGLGPTAGVLAIALAYGGMLGKVFAEILESVDRAPAEALLHNGAPRLHAFLYGVLPQAAAELASYLVYRWECAIRASVVMGFVGAGGIGQRLDEAMKMFEGGTTASILLVFMVLVAGAGMVSTRLRRQLDGVLPT